MVCIYIVKSFYFFFIFRIIFEHEDLLREGAIELDLHVYGIRYLIFQMNTLLTEYYQ
jgi:hypothetical protein